MVCFAKKELIVRGGSNISPVEVEQALLVHPAVLDAAVFGEPDEALGQQVIALVQLTTEGAGVALDEILTSAATRLADYKVPARLQRVDMIPKNAAGKTDRKALPALMGEL